ncbi:MAG: hypothetical protein HW390_1439 [Candidatus Brocadiaceae bacterium]|nr:hypothetical protein [Candidatus Brocadiaceae bacterium]
MRRMPFETEMHLFVHLRDPAAGQRRNASAPPQGASPVCHRTPRYRKTGLCARRGISLSPDPHWNRHRLPALLHLHLYRIRETRDWCRPGRYDLVQVEGIGLKGKAIEIYTNKTQALTNRYPVIQAHQLNHQGLVPVNKQGVETDTVINRYQATSSPCTPLYEGGGNGAARDTENISSRKQGKDIFGEENLKNKITISLRTPLRIRFDGQITDSLEFHVLLRNLLRRISSLSYFHCGKKLDMDFRGLIENARAVKQTASDIHWYDWSRYSTRQEEWMSLGGILGNVSYGGDLSEFMTLLRLGEYIHVGKGTSFGLGKYEVIYSTRL